jgi:signal peptidase II
MLIFVFSALIVALDQFFKHYIVRTLEMGETGPEIIPGFLGLTRWENDGAMLNILSGQQWLLAGIAFVVSIALIMILLRYNDGFWGSLGLASILGGAVGNLVDRIFNDGAVVDMFRTLPFNFPIFNIADILITLGFAVFLVHFISLFVGEKKREKAHIEGDEYEDEESYEGNYENNYENTTQQQTGAQAEGYSEFPEYPPNEVFTPQSPHVSRDSQPEYAPTQPHYEPPQTHHIPEPHYEPQAQYEPEVNYHESYQTQYPAEADVVDSTTDITRDYNFTYDELDLDVDLSDIEDYDVDALLREYGLDDEV